MSNLRQDIENALRSFIRSVLETVPEEDHEEMLFEMAEFIDIERLHKLIEEDNLDSD